MAFFVYVSPGEEAFIPLMCQALRDDYINCWGAEPNSALPTYYIIVDAKSDSFAADFKQMAEHFCASERRRNAENLAIKRKE